MITPYHARYYGYKLTCQSGKVGGSYCPGCRKKLKDTTQQIKALNQQPRLTSTI